jgi:hypothetical protein
VNNNNLIKYNRNYMHINIIDYSNLYSDSYHPSTLFGYCSDYYYCSEGKSAYFELDFSYEYYITKIEIYYNDSYLDCIPKNYDVQIFDNKKREINKFEFKNSSKISEEDREINEMVRYMKFIFKDNFGRSYIIIKRIDFEYKKFYNIE